MSKTGHEWPVCLSFVGAMVRLRSNCHREAFCGSLDHPGSYAVFLTHGALEHWFRRAAGSYFQGHTHQGRCGRAIQGCTCWRAEKIVIGARPISDRCEPRQFARALASQAHHGSHSGPGSYALFGSNALTWPIGKTLCVF